MPKRLWTDEEMLEVLRLKDEEGWTAEKIGERFGVSKSAILGMIQRIRKDTDAHDLTPELNGTMDQGWIKKGLKLRKLGGEL